MGRERPSPGIGHELEEDSQIKGAKTKMSYRSHPFLPFQATGSLRKGQPIWVDVPSISTPRFDTLVFDFQDQPTYWLAGGGTGQHSCVLPAWYSKLAMI